MDRRLDSGLILGRRWSEIQGMQQGRAGRAVDVNRAGDYGADPIGDGRFRMVPSGDVVDMEERNRRLDDSKQAWSCPLCGQRIDDGKPCGCGARP